MLFVETNPTREDYWRSVILFGRNAACYKFALAKSLLELATKERDFIRLDELALPFAQYIAEHVKQVDKQGTSHSSRFLRRAVRQFNKGELEKDALIRKTLSLGFENVIDAFHMVNKGPIPIEFFVDDRKHRRGINHYRRIDKTEGIISISKSSSGNGGTMATCRNSMGIGT